ncbi:MAG: GDP-mannose 4,6-dehydratase [Acidobacteriia bacterium]|nr:GDP-mannose 4,6-dehydratase [Terriglobia bacterium]
MKSLITGCSGLIGPHLAERLLAGGDQVHGTYAFSADNLRPLRGRMSVSYCDIREAAAVSATVEATRPERIFHLAAQSRPLRSWEDPESAFRVNVLGTLHLLEAVRRQCPEALVVVFGSSAEYGQSLDRPLDEASPLRPDSPYGASKAAAEMLADVYGRAYKIKVIRLRPFFVVGPGRAHNIFVDFAQRIVAAENGLVDGLDVGRQSTVRDILDVRDAASAIALIAERGGSGEVYNVCTGKGVGISAALMGMAKLSSKPLRLRFEATGARPLDAAALVGDNTRLRRLGWEPRIALEQTLADILDFWRAEFLQRQSHNRAQPVVVPDGRC